MVSELNSQERAVDTSTERPAESVLPCNFDSGGNQSEVHGQEPIHSDSGSESERPPGQKRCKLKEMQLGDDWEASFVAFSAKQEANEKQEETASISPIAACPFLHHKTDDILELLDLDKDGIPVTWPPDLDARVAKVILRDRALLENAARSPDRARAS